MERWLGDHQLVGRGCDADVAQTVNDFEGDVVAATGQRSLVDGVGEAIGFFVGGASGYGCVVD